MIRDELGGEFIVEVCTEKDETGMDVTELVLVVVKKVDADWKFGDIELRDVVGTMANVGETLVAAVVVIKPLPIRYAPKTLGFFTAAPTLLFM